jgi:hypothetical protein
MLHQVEQFRLELLGGFVADAAEAFLLRKIMRGGGSCAGDVGQAE